MGHNRAGDNAKLKRRRQRKEELRLILKAKEGESEGGVVTKVAKAATAAAKTVGKAVKAAAQKVKDAVTPGEAEKPAAKK